MKLLCFFWFVIVFSTAGVFAQQFPDLSKYQTDKEKIGVLGTYCNALLTKGLNDKQNCESMVTACRIGLQLCKPGDEYVYSLFTIFAGYGYEYGRVHLDSAVYFYEKGLEDSRRLKFDFNIDRTMERLNYLYFDMGKFKQREKLISIMSNILDSTKNMTRKVVLSGSMSEYYLSIAKYEQAIKYNLKNIEFQKIDMLTNRNAVPDNIGVKYVQIGGVFNTLGQYQKAIEYYDLATPYFKIYRNGKINLYMNYVLVYVKLKEVQKAINYYKKIYEVMKPNDSSFHELSNVNQYLSDYYINNNNTAEAYKYGKEALRLAKKSGNEQSIINANKTYGSVLYKRGSTQESVNYLEKAAVNAYGFSKEDYASIQNRLALSYADLANYELAYQHVKIYAALKDTLYEEASKRTLAEMEARFQNNAKKQEIKVLNAENETKNLLLQDAKRIRLFMAAVILFLMLIAFLFFNNIKTKQKANYLLGKKNQQLDILNEQLNLANQTKAKLFSIISHDLRSPVSQLFTFLRVQQINPQQIPEEAKVGHQKKLMDSASTLLLTMEDLLLWSKSQMEHFELDKEEIDLDQLFNEAIGLMQNQAEAKNLEIKKGEIKVNTLQSDQNLMIIVLRNLLQNAINNAKRGSTILLNVGVNDQDKTYLSIFNEGEMIPKEKIDELLNNQNVNSKSSGYGLLIVKELLQRLNANLNIESSTVGTLITVSFT